ncbi:MAG: beta-ketoacyl-ACP synthase II [Nitrospirota bacterium]|nr:beta-ketoacyl-ACP synthase II [Nitrospirota bacterium]
MKKVVITGIGAVTPLGNHMESTWDSLMKGVSGAGQITRFDPAGLPFRIAGELKGFAPDEYLTPKEVLRMDPFAQYAVAAAMMACEDAGLAGKEVRVKSAESREKILTPGPRTQNSELLTNAGVIIGSSRGGISSLENALERHLLHNRPFSALLMSSSTINMASSCISIKLGIKGPALGISTACASGTNAIGEALEMIRSGRTDIVLAGGSDAPVCRLAVGGYGASGALSKKNREPEKASRPFDRDRDGFVIAEGAGVLVLEDLDHALKRGAGIYAEIAGYGTSSDAFHQTKPDSAGEAAAIKKALDDAGVSVDEVDYINAHATSTPLGDLAEAEAVRKVFGSRTDDIYVGACKCMSGHMLAASGAVETAVTALSISRGMITPVINIDNPGPGCELNFVTSALKRELNTAITNSFGFGGVNAVLVLRKFRK